MGMNNIFLEEFMDDWRGQLLKILPYYPLLGEPKSRRSTLFNSGLGAYYPDIEGGSIRECCNNLIMVLSTKKIQTKKGSRRAIVRFLKYILDCNDLNPIEDAESIVTAIYEKLDQEEYFGENYEINKKLEEERASLEKSRIMTQPQQKLDENIFIQFDLTYLCELLNESLDRSKGVFAYSINGNLDMLQKIITRIFYETQSKLQSVHPINIRPGKKDLINVEVFGSTLSNRIEAFINSTQSAIINVLWDESIPSSIIDEAASQFVLRHIEQLNKQADEKGCCIIVLWVGGSCPVSLIQNLPLQPFKVDEIEDWFENKVKLYCPSEDLSMELLQQLRDCDGNVRYTYIEFDNIKRCLSHLAI